LHGNTLGMEVVLADGRILNDMRALRKDNTGYDLKQLFIGSEGTLGVITAAAIAAVPRPNSVNVSCFKLASFAAVQELFARARSSLGEILSAFEFWDSQCEGALAEHHANLFSDGSGGFFVLLETSGSSAEHDTAKLTTFLETIMTEGLVEDGVLAQDQRQLNDLWARREGIPEACSKQPRLNGGQGFGQVHKFDLSLPADCYYDLVPLLRRMCPVGLKVFGFGHVGDGNLHVNLVDCVGLPQTEIDGIGQFIFDWTARLGGSVSAEHGIGQAKRNVLHLSKSRTAIELMRSFKELLDPNCILNPGKVL
jgi:FAD/FMN-containing dehydrogenase